MEIERERRVNPEIHLLKGTTSDMVDYEIEGLQYFAPGEEADKGSLLRPLSVDRARLFVSFRGERMRWLILEGTDAERVWGQFLNNRINRFGRPALKRAQPSRRKTAPDVNRHVHPAAELLQCFALGIARSRRQHDCIHKHVANCEECTSTVRAIKSQLSSRSPR